MNFLGARLDLLLASPVTATPMHPICIVVKDFSPRVDIVQVPLLRVRDQQCMYRILVRLASCASGGTQGQETPNYQ
jgi:hypothetical protein